ncbi:MAG: hypothetical protein HYW50_04060 [Candidatus Diapherotrites archaeon]|nr:hypothetical protein [Candidatus Diapherotrites archaeon]
MFSTKELSFAQKYPFTSLAKKIIRETDFSLEEIPESVVSRAKLSVLTSLQGKQYSPKVVNSASILRDEIFAFPVAKIFVSITNTETAFRRFSKMVSKNVFSYLEKEPPETVFEIAKEAGVKFSLENAPEIFASVSLPAFLSIDFGSGFFKLVNQKVEGGKVLLSKNEFIRFVSLKIEKQLLESFPIDVSGVPKNLKSIAKEISALAFESKKAEFKDLQVSGVHPEFFPPCIEKLYTDILGGRNLSHMERFALATFMLSIGMPVEEVITLYSFTPNFDRKITAYQVTRLAGKGGTKYSAASCSKMAEYKLRLPLCPCIEGRMVRHPVQFYKESFAKKQALA